MKYYLAILSFIFFLAGAGSARAANELITVPVVLADYYGWAYTEVFEDRSYVFGWSCAGVDALGWSLFFETHEYDAALFMINTAELAKTIYPLTTLLGATDKNVRERAWITVGTHAATIITLEFLGRPALSVQTSMGPSHDGVGISLACKF